MLQKYDLLDEFMRCQLIDQIIESESTPDKQPSRILLEQHTSTLAEAKADHLPCSKEISSVDVNTDKLRRYKEKTFSGLAKTYYLKNRCSFDVVLYGYICVAERSLAYELYFRIIDDAQSFWSLATQYSQDSSCYSGGVIGPIRVSNLAPAIADQLLAMKPQAVCQPFLHDDCWHMLYLARHQRSALTNKIYSQIIDILFNQEIAKQIELLKAELTHFE
jgi:hypothetical protein